MGVRNEGRTRRRRQVLYAVFGDTPFLALSPTTLFEDTPDPHVAYCQINGL